MIEMLIAMVNCVTCNCVPLLTLKKLGFITNNFVLHQSMIFIVANHWNSHLIFSTDDDCRRMCFCLFLQCVSYST